MLKALLENLICETLWVFYLPLNSCWSLTTRVWGRLLLILFSEEIYFSNDTVHHAKGKTSWPTICLSPDQGHRESRLPTAWCHERKRGGAEAWGTARHVAIDFSLRDLSTDAVVVVSFPHLYLSALSLVRLLLHPYLLMPFSRWAHLLALNLEGLPPSSGFLQTTSPSSVTLFWPNPN